MLYEVIKRDVGHVGIIPKMEHNIAKNMEHEMETGFIQGFIRIGLNKYRYHCEVFFRKPIP